MKLKYEKVSLFKNIDLKEISDIDKMATISLHSKGSIIHFENEMCEYLEIIQQGQIHIEQWNEEGDIKIIRNYHENDIFGMNLLYSDKPYYFVNVIAEEDTVIVKLHIDYISELLKISSTFRLEFIKVLSNNSKKIVQQIKTDFREPLRVKIINYLKELQLLQMNNTVILPITKTTLAKQLGVERTSLSRELQKMKNDELIDYNRSTIIVK